MQSEMLKVGDLARRTGLTVRTLHHYDRIGLVRPSLHTDSGHRLYTAADVARLQQVLSLREIGFSLEEARVCLDRQDLSPLGVIRLHLNRLREQIELEQALCERLKALIAYFGAAEKVSAEWAALMSEVRAAMDNGTEPDDPTVQALAKRWSGLVKEFTGGDPGIEESLTRLYKEQGPSLAAQYGYDSDQRMFDYIGKAMKAVKE
jgi:DNA-binding transcriptional MerR regulator